MMTGDLPRVKLAHLPTPIESLPRLSSVLGGPHLFVKRDDCTGLGAGGNKTRKLEFLVGDALAQGADTLMTEGSLQSNHCRQTAAAAAAVGMNCVLVLNRGYTDEVTGNLLLDQILGAEIVVVEQAEDRAAAMSERAKELTANGKQPYLIPTGGSNGVGAMGYASFMEEVEAQSTALGIRFDSIVTASGSGGTQGGLVLGRRILGPPSEIIGISDGEPRDELTTAVLAVANEGATVLQVDETFTGEDVTIYDEYYGEGYGMPTPEMVDSVRLVARTQGIVLDPVYSGKAMAGLIDLIRKGRFDREANILFLHTGGTPALFAYATEFAE
jgi:D-cysteine desulfhydrase family pyridoxal phosphate-dependent enzyme